MIVVMIHNRFGLNAVGGAEQVVLEELQIYQKNGDTVYVLSTEEFHRFSSLHIHHDSTDAVGIQRLFPLNICAFECLSQHSIFFRGVYHLIDLFNIHSSLMLWLWLKHVRPQLVITHNCTGLGLWLALRLLPHSWRWVHYLHDIQLLHPSGLMYYGNEGAYNAWYAHWYRVIMRIFVAPVSEVHTPSQWLLDEHHRFGFFCHTPVVHVQHKECSSLSSRPFHTPLRILFVGQLEPHKGILFALEALQAFTMPFTCTVIGSGSLIQQVQHAFIPVQWFHQMDHNHVLEYMRDCDILIVPSLCYENSPAVIHEALECGISIVASEIGGIPELIRTNNNCRLFQPGNMQDFIRAIENLIRTHYKS